MNLLARMLEPDSARRILKDLLPGDGAGTSPIRSVLVRDVTARPLWCVQLSAEVQSDASASHPQSRLLTAHRMTAGELPHWEARLRAQVGRARGQGVELGRLLAIAPELGLVIYPFPLDPRLKLLVKASDPKRAQRKLSSLLGRPFRTCEIDVLRYVPLRRCQMRFHLTDRDGKQWLVLGKLFRDERGESIHHSMRAAWTLFAENGDPSLTVPAPLGYCPDWRILVQEHVPGETLYTLQRLGGAREEMYRLAARSLRVLQRGPLNPCSRYTVPDELRLISDSFSDLRSLGIERSDFARSLDRIAGTGARISPSVETPVHRDFYDKQLIADGPRMAMIDFDTLARGCPEIDAGNFVAHLFLRTLQGDMPPPIALRAREAFLNEYQPQRPDLVAFFESAALFRLACKNLLRKGGERLAPMLLGRAEQLVN